MGKHIVLTGATGFVGNAVAHALIQQGETLTCISRRSLTWDAPQLRQVLISDLGPETDWSPSLQDADVVIHCAARVHVMHESAKDPLEIFRRVNVDATMHLARQAVSAGVRQFVYLSSVKVNGEATEPGHPFTENDAAKPQDAYGISKLEAEFALLALGESSGMHVTIIRPPLVYGPGVKANFLSMLHWVKKGIPLPLGSIHNQRSFVFLDNLVSLILCSLRHPAAAQQVFLVSDGHDLSTSELLRLCAQALDVPARLLPFPAPLLQWLARLAGKQSAADRLCQSLQVDISKAKKILGWTPPFSVEQGLRQTAQSLL